MLGLRRNSSSFFCFFQLPYLGGILGTGVGVNELQDLAVVAYRGGSITLFLVRCPASYVRKGVFRIVGDCRGELRDGCIEVASIKRSHSPFIGRTRRFSRRRRRGAETV